MDNKYIELTNKVNSILKNPSYNFSEEEIETLEKVVQLLKEASCDNGKKETVIKLAWELTKFFREDLHEVLEAITNVIV